MEKRALQWHQSFMKGRRLIGELNWEEYMKALNPRFGHLAFKDLMADLKNLKRKVTSRLILIILILC